MLQYKIPQNVGIEDKIVGPFSLRQLIILAVGGGISYVLFAIGSKLYELNVIEYIIIAFPALFALAAAMLKIHNVSFIKYLLLTLEFAIKPKKRYWNHRGIANIVAPDLTEEKKGAKKPETAETKQKNVNLRDVSAMLDSGGFEHVGKIEHEDIDKVEDDDLITQAYFGNKKEQSTTENMYWRTRDMQKKKLDILTKMPKVAAQKNTDKSKPQAAEAAETEEDQSAQLKQAVPANKKEPASKGSVVEKLAKVIHKANEKSKNNKQNINNVSEEDKTKKDSTVKSAPVSQTESSQVAQNSTETLKRKRKRKKKTKNAAPLRKETQINNTNKGKPVELMSKNKAPTPSIQPQQDPLEQEVPLSELHGGGEIEINLD